MVLTPFGKKVEEELDSLDRRHFQEARELLREMRGASGRRRFAGDYALNLLLLAASRRGAGSIEARTALEFFRQSMGNRVKAYIKRELKDSPYPEENLCAVMEPELELSPVKGKKPRYRAKWVAVLPAVRSRRKKLTDFNIENGWVLVNEREVVELFADRLRERALQKVERYSELDIEDPRLEELAGELALTSERRAEGVSRLKAKQAPLKEAFFPPCIKICLGGISSGARNYAITVLLTAFISYARIAPFSTQKDAKVADFVKGMEVIEEEIMPVIEGAAERCSPSLFEDQPLERMNVYYHLGLGLTSNPELGDSGNSPWYFVPNCDKVRREAPSLCMPDRACKEVKNPLTYYIKKRFRKK